MVARGRRCEHAEVPQVAVTLPYWLDRPAGEALAVVRAAEAAGIPELWIGEMATFEAFALAGAVAASTAIERIVVGPAAARAARPGAAGHGRGHGRARWAAVPPTWPSGPARRR